MNTTNTKREVKKHVRTIQEIEKELKEVEKDNKALDKSEVKEVEISKRTTPKALRTARNAQRKKDRAARIELNARLRLAKKDRTAKRFKVKVLIKRNAKGKKELQELKGEVGYHPNSPKVKSETPYNYAIPKSIVNPTLAMYPGFFDTIKSEKTNKVIRLESEKITLDFEDWNMFYVRYIDQEGNAKVEQHDYVQGITKFLRELLEKLILKRAA